ncbi:hypothetical protein HPB48_025207 [Haemaphysalis longicornis]|uniref:Uncharacterized protein n=1 Tax=Haemaphysalis longicornis TaxID=44386 RepID=A0A9J6H7A5_HAELO|nr:hypothetical protein HPB48_025207 [Haemaphysalis longicornis]
MRAGTCTTSRTPKRGGRQSHWVRSWRLWSYVRDYYPVKLVKTAELDPGRNYIVGYHPHGIMCMGALCNFTSEANDFAGLFPGIRMCTLTLNVNFAFPVYREFLLCTCGHGLYTS